MTRSAAAVAMALRRQGGTPGVAVLRPYEEKRDRNGRRACAMVWRVASARGKAAARERAAAALALGLEQAPIGWAE